MTKLRLDRALDPDLVFFLYPTHTKKIFPLYTLESLMMMIKLHSHIILHKILSQLMISFGYHSIIIFKLGN